MTSVSREFAPFLLEAVDEGLLVVGEEPRRAVYQYLTTICALHREEIPARLEEFAQGMSKALGAASKVLMKVMLKKLFQRIGSSFKESSDLEFVDYVKDAERRFEVVRQHQTAQQDTRLSVRSKKGQLSS